MPNKHNKNKPSPLTKPLSLKRYKKELKAATRSEFRPLQRELNKQNRISKLQSQDTSRYFRDYQRAIGAAREDTAAAYQQAQGSLGAYAAAAGSQDAALRAQLGTQAQQQAGLYGAQPSTASQDLALAGTGTRVQGGANMAGAIAGQGANTYGFLSAEKTNAKLAKAEALTAEARNRAQISDDKMALLREKADFKHEYLSKTREGERQYQLALKELRQNRKESARDRRFQASENAKDRRASKQAAKGDAAAAKDGNKADRRKDLNKALTLLDAYKYNQISGDPKKVIAALANKGIPPAIARRAVNSWLKKHKGGDGGDKDHGKGHDGPIDKGGDFVGGR